MPDRATLTGFSSGSLELMDKLASWRPSAAGVNLRDIIPEASGASGPEILSLTIVNCPLLIVRLVMTKGAVPLLVTVIFRTALDLPTTTIPKLIEVGITVISGKSPPGRIEVVAMAILFSNMRSIS